MFGLNSYNKETIVLLQIEKQNSAWLFQFISWEGMVAFSENMKFTIKTYI